MIDGAGAAASADAAGESGCQHCRGPTPPGAAFCCSGCDAVHAALQQAGLGDWYRLRDIDADALVGVAARPRGEARYAYLDSDAYRQRRCRPLRLATAEGAADGYQAAWAIDGMTCVACAWLIERVAQQQPGVREARVDLLGQRLELTFEGGASLAPLATTIGTFGYGVAVGDADDPGAARRQDLVAVAIAGALMGNTMLLTVPYYAGLSAGVFAVLFGWLSLVLGAAALGLPGRVFFANAWAALRVRHVSLDIPIALGLAAAWGYSALQLARGAYDELYLDSLTMLVFTLRLGRFFQARTVERAVARARLLAAAMPELVPALRGDAFVPVAPEELCAGDVVRIDPGMRLPAEARLDAIAVAGGGVARAADPVAAEAAVAHVDLQVVSGEEAPRAVAIGAILPAGARAVDDALLLTLREDALAAVPPPAGPAAAARAAPMLADRLGAVFTFAVLGIAGAAFVGWALADGVAHGAEVAMVVLIVACPCAIGLATPATVALAVAAAARRGVLVREPSTLERASRLVTVVFDKTGTVTEGRPEVIDRWYAVGPALRPRLLRALVDLEASSRHPIARGLVRALEVDAGPGAAPARGARVLSGEGIVGVGGLTEGAGLPLLAVSLAAARRRGLDLAPAADPKADGPDVGGRFLAGAEAAGASVVVVFTPVDALAAAQPVALQAALPADDDAAAWRLCAAFALRDALRADARAVIDGLRREDGLSVALLSGDSPQAVAAVAARIGVADAQGGVDPAGKARVIAALQTRGPVAMVGDGHNDVAALQAASIAVSLAGATPAAIAASEVVLQSGGLGGLRWLFARARRVRRDIGATLVLAGLTNALGIGAAVADTLTPLVAALWMPLSSAMVVAVAMQRAHAADAADTAKRA